MPVTQRSLTSPVPYALKVVIAGTYALDKPDTVFKTRDKHFLFHLRVRGVTHHFYILAPDSERLAPSPGRLYAR
jgi:hypothetical protein